MTTMLKGTPPRERFFSGRHMRGWVAGTTCLGALVLTARCAVITVDLLQKGDIAGLIKDGSFWGMLIAFGIAYLATRKDGVGVEARWGKFELKIHPASGPPKKEFPPDSPTDEGPAVQPRARTKRRTDKNKD